MVDSCPSCTSTNLHKRGTKLRKKTGVLVQQYKCTKCFTRFNMPIYSSSSVEEDTTEIDNMDEIYVFDDKNFKKFVITSHQFGKAINKNLLSTIESYCRYNSAMLLVLVSGFDYEESFEDEDLERLRLNGNLIQDNINLNEYVNIYSTLGLPPSVENPLAGLDNLSKGKSLIIGHPVLQMKTLPVFGDSHPIMLHTTGSISDPSYNEHMKSGAKAMHNHSYSALVLEIDDENELFHIRVLNSSENGSFNDLDIFYSDNVMCQESVEAIIFGDTHATIADEDVLNATFTNDDSIVKVLQPRKIVHHDLLDFGIMQSHHNKKSFFKRYKKYFEGKDSVKDELQNTFNVLMDSLHDSVEECIIISSNHNDHLVQYLESIDIKNDYKNAKLYHYLMYEALDDIENGNDVNPFKTYFNMITKDKKLNVDVKFLGREELYYIKDILISSHGDRGIGGMRFTPTQGRKYPHKMVVGHSHSPSITCGCWQTGTMTGKLDYTEGTPTAWMNTHCIIHQSGKRQFVSVVKGKWKLD
jgi:hypothetical protein